MKGLTRVLLLSQIIIGTALLSLSFFWYVPLFVNYKGDFDGKCILFTTGKWSVIKNETVSQLSNIASFVDVKWGAPVACNFNLFVGLISSLCAVYYIFWESLYLTRGVDNSRVDAIVASCVSCVMTLFSLLAALVLSIGWSRWCDAIMAPPSYIRRCENAQSFHFLNSSSMNTSQFYSHLQLSQFGAWSVWVCWLIFSALCLVKNSRHKREADFLVTLGKERERLLESVSSGNESL